MNRDMDIVRRIALATAELGPGEQLQQLEDIDPDTFAIHVVWMKEAGLIHAITEEVIDGSFFAIVLRLTWDGCEFADAVRDDTLWRKAKENVLKPSASFTFRTLGEWLKTEILQGFPTIR